MIKGIGVDLVNIRRVEDIVKRWGEKFLPRVFTSAEIDYAYRHKNPYPYLAARFAAKEAMLKALGKGIGQGIDWRDIEVSSTGFTAPQIVCHDQALQHLPAGCKIHLSISHDSEYAIAQVVLEG
ncbi:MAG: holo-ACP synthase [Candidatus Schekmanbacteria bacterium]|nr:holo-ACP synthase [Candidatus Schekmanbacteria bacterium]